MTETFSWLSLDDDEEIVWSGGPRRHVVLWVAVPALVIPALLLAVRSTLLSGFIGLLVWGALTALGYVYVTNVDYVVSSRYIYSKWGVLGRSITQIGLHNVQDTTLSQGIFGTQGGYGTVSFSTAGGEGAALAFYVVDEPATAKSAVDRQVAAVKQGRKEEAGCPVDSGVEEFLSELRATRNAAQRIDHRLEQRRDQS